MIFQFTLGKQHLKYDIPVFDWDTQKTDDGTVIKPFIVTKIFDSIVYDGHEYHLHYHSNRQPSGASLDHRIEIWRDDDLVVYSSETTFRIDENPWTYEKIVNEFSRCLHADMVLFLEGYCFKCGKAKR